MGKRKGRSPEEDARRAKIRELLQLSGVSSMADIQVREDFTGQRSCGIMTANTYQRKTER